MQRDVIKRKIIMLSDLQRVTAFTDYILKLLHTIMKRVFFRHYEMVTPYSTMYVLNLKILLVVHVSVNQLQLALFVTKVMIFRKDYNFHAMNIISTYTINLTCFIIYKGPDTCGM